MNADGSDQRVLLTYDGFPHAAARPSWSPDGSRIAIAQQLEGYSATIYLVDAHTSEHLTIATSADRCDDLTWSPTVTRIAFVCGAADGSGARMAHVATVGEPGVTDLGTATRIDWARALEPLGDR